MSTDKPQLQMVAVFVVRVVQVAGHCAHEVDAQAADLFLVRQIAAQAGGTELQGIEGFAVVFEFQQDGLFRHGEAQPDGSFAFFGAPVLHHVDHQLFEHQAHVGAHIVAHAGHAQGFVAAPKRIEHVMQRGGKNQVEHRRPLFQANVVPA